MANDVGFPRKNVDDNAWGSKMNDALHTILSNDWYDVGSTGASTPPTIEAGSQIQLYRTVSDSIESTSATGNIFYPEGTTQTYLCAISIYESTQRTHAWGSSTSTVGNFSTVGLNSVYYLYAFGCKNTTYSEKFQGRYGAFTSTQYTPTWSDRKGGWYASVSIDSTTYDCKVLARFQGSSTGGVTEVAKLMGRAYHGYISDYILSNSTGNITISPCALDIGGKYIEYKQAVTIDMSSTLTASRWYCIGIVESGANVGKWGFFDSSNSTALSISGNALNAANIYSTLYNYCRDTVNSTVYRVIAFVKSSSNANAWDYVIHTPHYPRTHIIAGATTAQSINSSALTQLTYTNVMLDVNGESSAGLNFTPKIQGTYQWSGIFTNSASTGYTATHYTYLSLIKGSTYRHAAFVFGSGESYTPCNFSIPFLCGTTEVAQLHCYQNTTAAITVYTDINFNKIEIVRIN